MSLTLAVVFGTLSAAAFAVATAVQHSAAHEDSGDLDAGRLLRLLRNPRWLASLLGDGVGVGFQAVALANGPAALVQPLLVLAVPMALPIGHLLGGPRPTLRDLLGCAAILAGLAGFLGLLGDPGDGRAAAGQAAVLTAVVALAGGAGLCWLVSGGRAPVPLRAAVFGAVAGAWFGLGGVLLNSAALLARHRGLSFVLTSWTGWCTVVAMAVLACSGLALVQAAFQIGSLAASFPANEAAGPVAAVVCGGLILHQHVPVDPGHLVGYLLALLVIVFGTVRLAEVSGPPVSSDAPSSSDRSRAL